MTAKTHGHGIADYATALASAAPAPGGGASAAAGGAFAAALTAKVCNLTLGRPAFAAVETELGEVLNLATAAMDRLLELAHDDETAYGGYVAATRLPKESDTERATRRQALNVALIASAEVPLATAETSLAVLFLLERVATVGNPHAVSDALVGATLAEAAVRAALIMVRVNAKSLTSADPDRAAGYLARAETLDAEASAAASRVLSIVAARG